MGITISNEKLKEVKTWQFNLNFSLSKDQSSQASIEILKEAGIDFDQLQERGVPPIYFSECLISSGIIFNSDVQIITFHGTYDFSYLIKCVINQALPPSSDRFFDLLKIIFPNFVDIKYIMMN